MAAESDGVLTEFAAHLLDLTDHDPRMMRDCQTCRRRPNAPRASFEQRDAASLLHASNALAR